MEKFAYFLLLAPLMATACAPIQGYPDPVVKTSDATAEVKDYVGATSAKFLACSADPKEACRNEIVDARVYAIDAEYNDFARSFNEDGNGVSLTTDAITLILGGLGSTLGSAGTKAALAAASTGVSGINSSYDKNVLAQKTAAAIITQMDASRTEARVTIETGKKAPIANYSLQAGLDDVLNYQRAGSIPYAIQELSAAASANQTIAKSHLETALK